VMGADWLLFTSKNAVTAFMHQLSVHKKDIRNITANIAAVGEKTAGKLKEYHLYPDFIPAGKEYSARTLGEGLSEQLSLADKVCHVKAKNGAGDLEEILASKCDYTTVSVYENKENDEKELQKELAQAIDYGKTDAWVFTSASSVNRVFKALSDKEKDILRQSPCFAIGEKTKEALAKQGAENVLQSEKASLASLAESVVGYLSDQTEE